MTSINDQLQISYPPTGASGQPSQVYPAPAAPVVTAPPAQTVVPGVAAAPSLTVQAATDTDRQIGDRILEQFQRDSISPAATAHVTVRVDHGDVYLEGYVN